MRVYYDLSETDPSSSSTSNKAQGCKIMPRSCPDSD